MSVRRTVSFEIRSQGEQLHAVMITEGRAASGGRRELFTPGSVEWPADGVAVLTEHRGEIAARALPVREQDGRITLRTFATDLIRSAVAKGRKWMSVEFHALQERTTAGGVREILRAFVPAAALVLDPEYDSTAAEVRQAGGRIEGTVPLEKELACQCRSGCDSVRLEKGSFDEALQEVAAGTREVTVFTTSRFGQPIATSSGTATFRRAGNSLEFSTGPLDVANPVVRETLQAHRSGSARFVARPYIRDAGSDVEKVGKMAVVHRADFRAMEVAAITGPVGGLQPIRIVEPPAPPGPGPRERERGRVWL